MLKKIIVGIAVLTMIFITANADELKKIKDFNIPSQYVSFIPMNDNFLTSTGVKKIKQPDGKIFMCCIVYTAYKGDSALERQKMITICRNKALSEIQKSKKCTIHAVQSLKTGVQETSKDGKTEYNSISELLNISKTEVYGVVSSWPVIGTWISADSSVFYLATGKMYDAKMHPIEIVE